LLAPQQDAEHFNHIWNIVENSGMWRGETWLSGISGVSFAAWLDIFSVRDRYQKVSRYVAVFSDITPMKEQQQKLEQLAYHDALTQLPNRTLFMDRLQQALALNERTEGMLAVCYFDLDGFKPVNDSLGHEAGDQLLSQLAQRVRHNLRAGDTVARMGGDEFALLLCNLQSADECHEALDRLLENISAPYLIDGHSVQVSASVGVTLSPPDDANPDILLRHADQAMYLAKIGGKGRYHLFDQDQARQARNQYEAVAAIQYAMEQGELRLFYQPKVNMRLGTIIGMEALIRWQHPELGLRSPADFLPMIENSSFGLPSHPSGHQKSTAHG
jgi:diguanylate cyclase (GGDEF)-like protein